MGDERHSSNPVDKPAGKPSASPDHTLTPNAAGFNITIPTVSLPKGGGAVKSLDEQFNVNPVNGSANFSIPLPVGSARGFAPALSLSYSTGSGNGIFGLGWGMSLPSIKRKTDKELPQYHDLIDSDMYLFSGSEDLVPAMQLVNDAWEAVEADSSDNQYTVKRYRPRIEDAFAKIERWTKKQDKTIHWRVTSKDNTTTLFGDTPECRIAHEGKIFEWLPRITWDDKGNCALYEYKAEDGVGIDATQTHNANRINGNAVFVNTFLKRIRCGNTTPYNENGAVPSFVFETVFDYGEFNAFEEVQPWTFRADAFSSYQAGFEIRTCRLCSRVLLFHHFAELPGGSACVQSLDFTYGNNGQKGNFTFLTAITITGYKGNNSKSLPPLTFSYQPHEWNTTVQTPDREELVHAPVGIFEPTYQWVDLYSEGLSGILSKQEAGLHYKHNLGNGKFSEAKLISPQPSFWNGSSDFQLQELEADGTKYLTSFNGVTKGFFKIDDNDEWQAFDSFKQVPNLDFKDANTRLIDLNGDGKAELLITKDNVFAWYPSLGEEGYDACRQVWQYFDEEKGPHIVFNDKEQSIFLADMNGDGLTDIVRIKNGSVCYWPNLGYGKFGAKVTMDNAPVFDHPDLFNASFIKLADIDGSGTTDIIYTANQQCIIWLNQHGNGFLTETQRIDPFPDCNPLTQVAVLDFLGNGTSCIVWSSVQPKDQEHPLRYIDLMNSKKPHLLVGYKNNMGKEVALEYNPSTYYYLQDKAAGEPWVTKLPFPVHCLCKVITWDRIMKTRVASEWSYHHGYYDHTEREFRGFGRVDQSDAENIELEELGQPPVLTKSWYHTGAFVDGIQVISQFAHEYAQNEIHPENLLPEPEMPAGLSINEYRQAIRACKGKLLRKEIYALDGSDLETKPYTVEQNNCSIQVLQPQLENKYACFITPDSEHISYQYERNVADPRIAHRFILETDAFGNITKTAALVYPRKPGDEVYPAEQLKQYVTYRENVFTNNIDTNNSYRVPSLYQTRLFELTGLSASADDYYSLQEIKDACAAAAFIDYDATAGNTLQKRLVDFSRLQFRGDNGTTVLPFGTIASKALVHQSFKAAFNQSQLTAVYNTSITPAVLTNSGGYVLADNYYWTPSPKPQYDATHFFLPVAYTDAFNNVFELEYDNAYHLFIQKTTDALGNEMLVKEFNYRVMQAYVMQDANDNVSAVRFDELGMVVSSFLVGKQGVDAGDTFDETSVEASVNDVPGVTVEYHVSEWYDQSTQPGFDINNYKPLPAFFKTTALETHADPAGKIQQSYSYFNGSGKVIVKKVQAEPGEALQVNPDGTVTTVDTTPAVRWVGNGRVILNNKGNAIKQYEPYFSVSPVFDDEQEMAETGVTSILHYDALSRLIQTVLPNLTFTKVEFTPWLQKTFDANDTVALSDWYKFRITTPDPAIATPEEISAANKAFKHNNTPAIAHLDTLGRVFLQEADLATSTITTHITLDIEGKPLMITDGLNRTVMNYIYDMLSRPLQQDSMDAGMRLQLPDATDKMLLRWDARDHEFAFTYDTLRRPLQSTVKTGNGAALVYHKIGYGESLSPAAAKANNLRGIAYKTFDQCGIITIVKNDFKGNQLSSTRQLASEYKNTIDWTNDAAVALETEIFTTLTEYDALNRTVKLVTPHTPAMAPSELLPHYNEMGVLNSLDIRIRDAANATPFVTNIDYNAKGQRDAIYYGNGTKTKYRYDPLTFRLINLLTTRNNGNVLQDIDYTFDPVGNITRIKDNAQADVFFDNEMVEALNEYEYDAIYRLINATGRKHAGQTDIGNNGQFRNHPFINSGVINPNDAQAFRNYTEVYAYDKAGNMQQQQHIAKDSNWTRTFVYDDNRLTRSSIAGDDYDYTYDTHGNMHGLETVNNEVWDFNDHFKQAGLTGGGTVYYVYDTKGERVRKIVERQNGIIQERIYLGAIEIYREKNSAGTITLERETLQVMDNNQRLALVDTPVVTPAGSNEVELIRYQYANHAGSSSVELDAAAQIISYEEYFPYGTTSYAITDSTREVPPKRYRYTSKERDDESGLNYHGARYYALWLCRWTKCDPIGIGDGLNQYEYVHSNPVNAKDVSGKDAKLTVDEKAHTITYSTTVHVYADKADKTKVEAAAKGAEKFYANQNKSTDATFTDDGGQQWKVQFDVKYQVHTDHGIPARLIKEDIVKGTERWRRDALEITDEANFKKDGIKPGDNFMDVKQKGDSIGLGGDVVGEMDKTEEGYRSVHARMGSLYMKKDEMHYEPGGIVQKEVNHTDTELKNNLIHETGHQLGFDERYSQATGNVHPTYDRDFMGNETRYDNKKIFKEHFEDAARFALDLTHGESSSTIFRGDLDTTNRGAIVTGAPTYNQAQTDLREKEVKYFRHFKLLNPW